MKLGSFAYLIHHWLPVGNNFSIDKFHDSSVYTGYRQPVKSFGYHQGPSDIVYGYHSLVLVVPLIKKK